MTRYLLDTNTVSELLRENPTVTRHVVKVPMASLFISSITEGELRYGVAMKPTATRLNLAVSEFLKRTEALPWNADAASHYGKLRASMERNGKSLGPLDFLIAAHAISLDAVLVTNDRAFTMVPGLTVEDWAVAPP